MSRARRVAATLLAALILPASAAADDARLTLRWLGVAGFALESGDDTILHDPYLSRPGLLATLFTRYEPDPAVLRPLLAPGGRAPELGRADLVLIGHSHFDHLGDAPWIARETGAVVAGSETTVNIARGYGVAPEGVRRVDPGDAFRQGAFDLRVVESRHGKIFFGRPPLQGTVTEPPDAPLHAFSFKLGDARGYLLTHRPTGLRLFVLSSAGLHRPAIEALGREGMRVDVLLPCVVGRAPDAVRVLIENLRPRLVVPHHFDDFFVGLAEADPGAPRDREDLEAFEAEVRVAAARLGLDTRLHRPVLFERIPLPTPR